MWKKFKKEIWQWRGVLITAPSITIFVILLKMVGILQILELLTYDQLFTLKPQQKPNDKIVIVEINESDIQYAGTWPMNDQMLAKLLNHVKQQKPKAIALDLYRDLPVEPGHKELVEIYKTTPNLIGIQKIVTDENSSNVRPIPELKAQNQISANDVILDPDGKIRRGLIYFDYTDEKGQSQQIESLAVRLASMYLGEKNINPDFKVNPKNPQDIKIKWGKAVFTRLISSQQIPQAKYNENNDFLKNLQNKLRRIATETQIRFSFTYTNKYDGGYEGVSTEGYQIMLNYHGQARRSFVMVSMKDVLEKKPEALSKLKDKIVIIGATAESLKDIFSTPYSNIFDDIPERMSGAEIHANFTSQIIDSALNNRPVIKSWVEWQEWLLIFVASSTGAILTWLARSTGGKKQSSIQAGAIFVVAIVMVAGSYFALLEGLWIPVIAPFTALVFSALTVTTYIAKSAGDIRETFGRYITDEVVNTLLENPEGLKLGGERKKITILTSDLRGFTATAERLPPEDVVKILNIYLGYMADIITKYNGTIDEFMGDGILVLFGAPTSRKDDAERAIACALDMQLIMNEVNEKMAEFDLTLRMGIGINTGEVVVGNIGSTKRTKYGVVGSQVNLTYRIESYTTEGQILISHSTKEEIKTELRIDGEKQVSPKGVKEPITIYDIGGIAGKYNIYLKKEEQVFLPLYKEIYIKFATLEGKDIGQDLIVGKLVKLSAKGAEVQAEIKPPSSTNIKFNISNLAETDNINPHDDVYAKVTDKDPGNGNFYIYLTAMPPNIEAMFKNLYQSIK
jgi:adenylate cyclase